jgi:hypothetical protein
MTRVQSPESVTTRSHRNLLDGSAIASRVAPGWAGRAEPEIDRSGAERGPIREGRESGLSAAQLARRT